MTVLQNEFFNASVHPVYALDGAPSVNSLLPQRAAAVDPQTGALRADGRPVRAQYALADTSIEVAGRELRRDPVGIVLYRVEGDVRLLGRTSGIYADSWTGPEATYTRWRCRGGSLLLTLASQPGLSEKPQTGTTEAGGGLAKRFTVAPNGSERTLVLPLRAQGGRCTLRLLVSPTFVPAQVLGSPDTRELGVHVTRLEYEPPRATGA
jgi:hypothetical protein